VEAFGYLERVNQELTREDSIAAHVARLRYAQPVCEPGFAAKIPPVETPILVCRSPIPVITILKTGESR
jgi:protoporphyrinogen oxidase